MILIVNVCRDRLSYFEFVKPVENLVQKTGAKFLVKHVMDLESGDSEKAEKTVICGTALKNFGYLDHLDKFEWIKQCSMPVLGICAGMQIMMMLFDGRIIDKTRIGRCKVKVIRRNILSDRSEFYSYFLNSKTVELTDQFEKLAETDDLPCMVKHKRRRLYGCLFHPEVLNPEIITNFIMNQAQN